MMNFDTFEKNSFESIKYDLTEKMEMFNKSFKTGLKPENGIYGVTEVLKDDGSVQRTFRNDSGLLTRDYLRDDKIFLRREKISDGSWLTTKFDDNGTGYLKTVIRYGENFPKDAITSLVPNAEIVKGNFIAYTDVYGRPILNKITDLAIKNNGREHLNVARDNSYYRPGDQRGHLIADNLGGPASLENIVPQMSEVNQGKMARVENKIRELKAQGHKVDYEVKTNYVGTDKRPTSFEPKITVDGEVIKLSDDLKKIYNDNLTVHEKMQTTVKEYTSRAKGISVEAHSMGKKEGLEAAAITLAVSTVDNASKFMAGEITAEEMVIDIAKDTGVAGAVGYGTAFVSSTVSQTMAKSSQALIKSLGNSGVPAAVISFGIDSYDSISDFAQGKIDQMELLYDLGESATSVAGSMAGVALAGAAAGSVVPGAGTVVGLAAGLVGGMVGCAVASEAYVTAVEAGTKGAEILADKAETFAQTTIDTVKEVMPEKVTEVADAFNQYISDNKLPIKIHI